MEIRRPSPHVLELIDSGSLLLSIGTLGIGFGLLATAFAIWQSKVAAGLIGALLGAGGAVCFAHARRVTHLLDAKRGMLTIAAKPVFGAERPMVVEQFKLRDLAGVELESRESSDAEGSSSTVYRVCYVFANGTRRPWTRVWTSSYASHAEPRNAAADFLSRAGFLTGRAAG
jgi:hypothetical protein